MISISAVVKGSYLFSVLKAGITEYIREGNAHCCSWEANEPDLSYC
jgi:hypothetical protein